MFASSISPAVARRRALNIEALLTWVIVDELPKRRGDDAFGSSARSMHPMWNGGLFTKIDNWSREPGMPAALGDPHPDAETVEAVLQTIDVTKLDLSAYKILHGIAPQAFTGSAAGLLQEKVERAQAEIRITILSCAKRKRSPDLDVACHFEPVGAGERPYLWANVTREVGTFADGSPILTTSHERVRMEKGGHYRNGTFSKLRWVSGVEDIVEARSQHAVWHATLSRLSEILAGSRGVQAYPGAPVVETPYLRLYDVRPPVTPAAPWIAPKPEPRVLIATPAAFSMQKEARGTVLPPTRPKHGPVRIIDPAERLAA